MGVNRLNSVQKATNLKKKSIVGIKSNKIKQKDPEIFHFHFFIVLQVASVTYFSENEAENLQENLHLAQISDYKVEYLENHLEH